MMQIIQGGWFHLSEVLEKAFSLSALHNDLAGRAIS